MPRQVVPSADKNCQEDSPEAIFKSDLQKSVKISEKAVLNEIGSNTDKL